MTRPGSDPTTKQVAVLRFMFSFYEQNDQLPTMAVIAGHFGYASTNAAHEHTDCLERRGLIERNALNKFKFTEAGRSVALAGRVVA